MVNEYLPSLLVVAANTVPEALINTTTASASPTLFESTIRPVIFTFERKRDDAFFSASSDIGRADSGADEESGVGVTSDFGVSAGADSEVVAG